MHKVIYQGEETTTKMKWHRKSSRGISSSNDDHDYKVTRPPVTTNKKRGCGKRRRDDSTSVIHISIPKKHFSIICVTPNDVDVL